MEIEEGFKMFIYFKNCIGFAFFLQHSLKYFIAVMIFGLCPLFSSFLYFFSVSQCLAHKPLISLNQDCF